MTETRVEWLVRHHLTDPLAGWSTGTSGAIAEFVREPGEACTGLGERPTDGLATDRGAIRLDPSSDVTALAYRTPAGPDLAWNHAVALCVPVEGAGPARSVLTELGPDTDAVRPDDRAAVLFDLGLGTPAVEACVRTADPSLLATLREALGEPVFSSGIVGALVGGSPHRVFRGAAGRVEVFAAIPPPDGRSPDGPHTHLLPHLLARGRTHAPTVPIPAGRMPVAHLHPAHPLSDPLGRPHPFDDGADAAFVALLDDFGDPALVSLERDVSAAVRAGAGPGSVQVPSSAPARATVAVTLRRLARAEPDLPGLALWRPHRSTRDDEQDPDGDRNGG